ncbi:MAG TPA: helix-turn-helix domain-containing protein [Smithellaceae bacterium]|nr:helix-turn-helix domain-containing protein [Smithellaceae bacterium]HRS89671.1 helix-turn-helix domain-containing protein [Smithellaceae bacterium]HRV25224.1 helix-turn-helix domain-containing protein [Smithellaceae bacterium]
MKKDFAKLNYYEMLDIGPDAAFFEIRHAYNAALQIYEADSMVSYSLFSTEERRKILELLERAYLTLINAQERKKYDAELAQAGIIPATTDKGPHRRPACIYDVKRQTGTTVLPKKTNKSILRESVEKNKKISEILSGPEINGAALKNIRKELGIPLERIAQETRVRLDYLNCIEEDKIDRLPAAAFLKGFIKAYLKSLCVEPADDISTRYMQWLERARKSG